MQVNIEISAEGPSSSGKKTELKDENSPLLPSGGAGATFDKKLVPPAAQVSAWVPAREPPENRPFQKLVIPFQQHMPSTLEFDGEGSNVFLCPYASMQTNYL